MSIGEETIGLARTLNLILRKVGQLDGTYGDFFSTLNSENAAALTHLNSLSTECGIIVTQAEECLHEEGDINRAFKHAKHLRLRDIDLNKIKHQLEKLRDKAKNIAEINAASLAGQVRHNQMTMAQFKNSETPRAVKANWHDITHAKSELEPQLQKLNELIAEERKLAA